MVLCIFGSRSLSGQPINEIINTVVAQIQPSEICTALEPIGVCQCAREFATENQIPLKTFRKETEHAQGQYHWRSVHAYEYADKVLIIHDGKSNGSKNEFDLAVKMGIPVIYYSLTTKNGEIQEVVLWHEDLAIKW